MTQNQFLKENLFSIIYEARFIHEEIIMIDYLHQFTDTPPKLTSTGDVDITSEQRNMLQQAIQEMLKDGIIVKEDYILDGYYSIANDKRKKEDVQLPEYYIREMESDLQ